LVVYLGERYHDVDSRFFIHYYYQSWKNNLGGRKLFKWCAQRSAFMDYIRKKKNNNNTRNDVG